MLVDRHEQMNMFEVVVPACMGTMDPELQEIDRLLENDTLFAAVKSDMSKRSPKTSTRGRKGTPVEVIIRMLLLKHLYDWAYEETERRVRDSFSLRQFSRVYLEKVPDDTVLIRWAQLISLPTLKTMHEHLVHEARVKRITRGMKMRVDTTVVETNVHYPTDSSLLQDSVRTLSRMATKISSVATTSGIHIRNFTRSAKHQALKIIKFTRGRTDEAKDAVKHWYQALCETTRRALTQVETLNEALKDNTSLKAQRFVQQCATIVPLVERIISQTRRRIIHKEEVPSAEKVLSLHEPTTSILRRGKRAKPNEFGHMVKIQEVDGNIISDIDALLIVTSDPELLVPSVERHIKQFDHPPSHLATDRGFSSTKNEELVKALHVKYVSLPAKGKLSLERKKFQQQRWFKKLQRFRAGSEAKISLLKRRHGLRRCLYKGDSGFIRWAYLGVIACNAITIARHVST